MEMDGWVDEIVQDFNSRCLGPVVQSIALQKLLTIFQQKYWCISDINNQNFNKTLINDVVSVEQPGPGVQTSV